MTKNEKILKQQVKELERLVEIKDEVIKELKSLINTKPYYYQYPLTYNSGSEFIIQGEPSTFMVDPSFDNNSTTGSLGIAKG